MDRSFPQAQVPRQATRPVSEGPEESRGRLPPFALRRILVGRVDSRAQTVFQPGGRIGRVGNGGTGKLVSGFWFARLSCGLEASRFGHLQCLDHRDALFGRPIVAAVRITRDIQQPFFHKLLKTRVRFAIESSTCSTGGADGLEQTHVFNAHGGFFKLLSYQAKSTPAVTHRSCFCDKQFTLPDYSLTGRLSPTSRKDSMSENHIDHHHKAAEHHEHAAKHHHAAAEHLQNGDHEKASHHAHAAHGHSLHAEHHANEAAKHHANEHAASEPAHSAA